MLMYRHVLRLEPGNYAHVYIDKYSHINVENDFILTTQSCSSQAPMATQPSVTCSIENHK